MLSVHLALFSHSEILQSFLVLTNLNKFVLSADERQLMNQVTLFTKRFCP